jgi:hypothetical protein
MKMAKSKVTPELVEALEPDEIASSVDSAAELATEEQLEQTTEEQLEQTTEEQLDAATIEQLDEEEAEFRALRCDMPGVKGSSSAGIIAVSVGKKPTATKNEFFRTHPTFRPTCRIVDHEVGMDKFFFAVTSDMVEPMASIGITASLYALYFTVTPRGAFRVVPVRQADGENEQHEYTRTLEVGLIDGIKGWVRVYTDRENKCYKVYPAHPGRFGEPSWPDLKPAKIFNLAFRAKGRLIDSPEHPLFKEWDASKVAGGK